ncbi:PAS domain-containing serine/threonine-protein kinase [Drosophila elegans]|uniref:PAS domain-containing serine/threonine-protein kinase n=1 Tax=Drosophila elegans TaxID=30023 RepID=UPI0007E8B0DF|nr:PAS domain-containing serine/threonine-protein kinase [Drosophila elegans]
MEDQGDVMDQGAGKLSNSKAQGPRNRCANDDPIVSSRQDSSSKLNLMDASSFSMPPPNLHSSKVINPNKAIFTIDANTGQIFIVNNKACQLLGYSSQELRNKGFFDLLNGKTESHISSLAEMQIEGDEGRVVLLSGKVIEMKTKTSNKILVSLWIRQISSDGRHIAVAEPVERHICHLSTDRFGVITSVDATTSTIFFYESTESVVGLNVTALIPFIKLPDPDSRELPKNLRKQRATGRTTDNVKFPLCLLLALDEGSGLNITVWVFQNLSGLLVVDDVGNILMCNQPFSLLMFGYGQDKIMNMHISSILPNFGKDSREDKSPNVSNTSITSNDWEPDTDPFVLDNDSSLQSCRKSSANKVALPVQAHNEVSASDVHLEGSGGLFCDLRQPDDCTIDDILTPVNASNSFPADEFEGGLHEMPLDKGKSDSTETCDASGSNPATRLLSSINGSFVGEAIHADGTIIEVVYSVLLQILPCSNRVYCIWVGRNPSTRLDGEKYNYANLTSTFNSMASTIEQSLGQVIKSTAAQNSSRPNSLSLVCKYEDELYVGDYSKHYTSIRQIGRGAYGYVNMAFRNTDRLLVITKFILKEKLCPQFMVKSRDCKEVPIEIHLLQTLSHKNIVSVLDVFENDLFYQMVMEKHGSGMDLWTFIERRPLMDEKLGSYIFRQVADAVNYLHEQKILHRDIKDENIIIDHNFNIKLIDFGSATFMEEGKFFSTFYGTTEYCSPEVLAGNRYVGPELEIWALGVTLYVLMFFENPFIDVEETLKAEIQIPKGVSDQLSRLLSSMLNKDPKYRCTMHQLITDPWLTQEVNPSVFSFSWIVPCKAHEANPDIYFSGYLYSSTSVLSTISPQESFSHIEESSIGGSDDARLASHRMGLKLCVNEAKHNKMDTLYAKQFQLNTSVSNHELRASLPDSNHTEIGGSICSSKSENDISKNKLEPCVSAYNVVSLHDVSTKPKTLDLK